MDFITDLFDFSFNKFITAKLIRLVYALFLVLIALAFLGGILAGFVTMFREGFAQGLGILCLTPIAAVLYVIMARVWTELIIVVFKIAENTSEIARSK